MWPTLSSTSVRLIEFPNGIKLKRSFSSSLIRIQSLGANDTNFGVFCRPVAESARDIDPPAMSLVIGTRLGQYQVLALLGAGGMGEVYRARDYKLNRDIALKVLPDLFAVDPDRLARFQREAQLLASLNHPHIAAIYGFEDAGDRHALVLELVEGPTLAERIDGSTGSRDPAQPTVGRAQPSGRPLPLEEALPIARQIAEALEAAHDHGIVHRDLKPGNIKLRPDGTVKVLDFGLAKARDPVDVEHDIKRPEASQSPTLTTPAMTRAGVILGTAAYMSPEQARGMPVDKRTDIWAFGCVLYEMLTGSRAFEGDHVTDTLAAVVRADPDWSRLPPGTPLGVRRLLGRCLEKNRTRRLRDIGDAVLDLDDRQTETSEKSSANRGVPLLRERMAWVSALVLLAGVVAAMAFRPVRPAPEMRLEITTPWVGFDNLDAASLALSPNAVTLAFVATAEGLPRLWVRHLNSTTARPIPGTGGASLPFWSPDSRSIGFFADGKLKRVDVDSGSVQILANAPVGRGGSWSRDGVILFTPTNSGLIQRVSATGGEAANVTGRVPSQMSHVFPQFLPDNRHFLFYVQGTAEARGVYVAQLDGGQPIHLLDADAAAIYATPGRLLFVRQGTLFAQDFDIARLALSGGPFSVADQVAVSGGGSAALSASDAGHVAYRAGLPGGLRQLVWVDRSGRELERIGEPISGVAVNPAISPDGRRLVLQRTIDGNIDIWQLELGRGTLSRLVSNPALDVNPIWSPDGRWIAFGSNRMGAVDLYRKSATGSGSEEPLLKSPNTKSVTDWSLDGQWLLYRDADPNTGFDVWALPMTGEQKPLLVVQTSFDERDAQFSPDGKWVAYGSNESGRFEIYVQPFPGPGTKWRISTNGGAQVRWRRDGKELFYIALDGRLAAVPITLDPNAQTVGAGEPTLLFTAPIGNPVPTIDRHEYMASADGERFLLNTLTGESSSPVTIILNFRPKP